MLTNKLKKGDTVLLENGSEAKIFGNRKGIIRLCNTGPVYTYNMTHLLHDEQWEQIELTEEEQYLKRRHKELMQWNLNTTQQM